MGIMGFAFAAGILIWWAESRETAAGRRPAACHYCWCAGELRIVRWSGGEWVHEDNGQHRLSTLLDIDVAKSTGEPPYAHGATPRTAEDELLSNHRN